MEEERVGGGTEPQNLPTSIELGLSPSLTSRYDTVHGEEFSMSKVPWNVRLMALDVSWSVMTHS